MPIAEHHERGRPRSATIAQPPESQMLLASSNRMFSLSIIVCNSRLIGHPAPRPAVLLLLASADRLPTCRLR